MKRDSRASKISDIVNSTLFDPMEVGIELSTDHRYLQNEEFKVFLHFAGQLARNYEKGLYDDRNEFACKSALAMIEGLEKAGLYDRKYWYARYDEMLAKSYE